MNTLKTSIIRFLCSRISILLFHQLSEQPWAKSQRILTRVKLFRYNNAFGVPRNYFADIFLLTKPEAKVYVSPRRKLIRRYPFLSLLRFAFLLVFGNPISVFIRVFHKSFSRFFTPTRCSCAIVASARHVSYHRSRQKKTRIVSEGNACILSVHEDFVSLHSAVRNYVL